MGQRNLAVERLRRRDPDMVVADASNGFLLASRTTIIGDMSGRRTAWNADFGDFWRRVASPVPVSPNGDPVTVGTLRGQCSRIMTIQVTGPGPAKASSDCAFGSKVSGVVSALIGRSGAPLKTAARLPQGSREQIAVADHPACLRGVRRRPDREDRRVPFAQQRVDGGQPGGAGKERLAQFLWVTAQYSNGG
jgi:hypothetical protein